MRWRLLSPFGGGPDDRKNRLPAVRRYMGNRPCMSFRLPADTRPPTANAPRRLGLAVWTDRPPRLVNLVTTGRWCGPVARSRARPRRYCPRTGRRSMGLHSGQRPPVTQTPTRCPAPMGGAFCCPDPHARPISECGKGTAGIHPKNCCANPTPDRVNITYADYSYRDSQLPRFLRLDSHSEEIQKGHRDVATMVRGSWRTSSRLLCRERTAVCGLDVSELHAHIGCLEGVRRHQMV